MQFLIVLGFFDIQPTYKRDLFVTTGRDLRSQFAANSTRTTVLAPRKKPKLSTRPAKLWTVRLVELVSSFFTEGSISISEAKSDSTAKVIVFEENSTQDDILSSILKTFETELEGRKFIFLWRDNKKLKEYQIPEVIQSRCLQYNLFMIKYSNYRVLLLAPHSLLK